MWNRKIEKTQNEIWFVKVSNRRKPKTGNQTSKCWKRKSTSRQMNNWNMNFESVKNLKIEIGNRKSQNWEMIKLKSNKRQSGMGIENRKTENPKMCICCCFPYVFRLCLHPSSDFAVRFKLNNLSKFNLFSVVVFFVFDFVSVFKFVLFFVFNFATKHFFIKVTSGQG